MPYIAIFAAIKNHAFNYKKMSQVTSCEDSLWLKVGYNFRCLGSGSSNYLFSENTKIKPGKKLNPDSHTY